MKPIARTLFGLMLLNPVIGSASALSQPENSAPDTVLGKEPSKLEGSSTPVRRWLGPDGKPLPFKSDEEIIDFMLNAKVASRKHTPLGVNRPYRVLLERDGVKMNAVFRQVSVKQKSLRLDDGSVQLFFRDECRFELAADCWDSTTFRRWWSESSSAQRERFKPGWRSPSRRSSAVKKSDSQRACSIGCARTHTMDIFDNLISNDDRNLGNMLIDPEWKLWMIDHTRAFRRNRELANPDKIKFCPRVMWNSLQKLDKQVLRSEMSGILVQAELQGLLERCDRMLEFLQKLIDQRGEGAVLF